MLQIRLRMYKDEIYLAGCLNIGGFELFHIDKIIKNIKILDSYFYVRNKENTENFIYMKQVR